MLDFYFHISHVEANVLYIILIGFIGSFIGSIIGIGGGIIYVPLLMFMNFHIVNIIASQVIVMTVSGTTSAIRHNKYQKIDKKLALSIALFIVLGSFIGVRSLDYLHNKGNSELILNIIFIAILSLTGLYNIYKNLKKNTYQENKGFLQHLPLQAEFKEYNLKTSLITIAICGLLTGIVSGITGLGGGIVLIPSLIYLAGLNPKYSIGFSAINLLFLGLANSTFYLTQTNYSDLQLAMFMIIGSFIGSIIGPYIHYKLSVKKIQITLSIVIIITLAKFIIHLII